MERALARWQAALVALERSSQRERVATEAILAPFVRQVSSQANLIADDAGDALPETLERQLAQLDTRTEALHLGLPKTHHTAPAVASVLAASSDDRGLTSAAVHSDQTGSSPPQPSAAAMPETRWLARRGALHGLGGGITALLVGWMAWKTSRFWPWIQQRERLAWIALGGSWWLILSPSWLGLVLMGMGLIPRRSAQGQSNADYLEPETGLEMELRPE